MIFHQEYAEDDAFDVRKVSYGCHIEKNFYWEPCTVCGDLTPWHDTSSRYPVCSTGCMTELYECYLGLTTNLKDEKQ